MAASASDLSGLGLLTWAYPPGLVDRVVAACGRSEQRRRLLPARLVVYFVLGLALFSPAPYLEVMRHLVAGLRGLGLLGKWHVPAKSSLFRARQRLGFEPLQVLFAATAKPMANESTPGAFWRGLRLLAVDGTCWDVADMLLGQGSSWHVTADPAGPALTPPTDPVGSSPPGWSGRARSQRPC
ncbi:transposase domain-containing protein [Streptomyces sp. NPDC058107]|uniref:transposase domain-containing protein n=1 Tax=Streptomyces sp. NPDC058107 TaxID=3346343 RepID=UPI0036E9D939